MVASLNNIEVCDGLHRQTPPTMIPREQLPQWKLAHESSQAGLFTSIFSFSTADPYIGEVISPMYLDFDKEDNPNQARKEAVAVIRKLIEEYRIPESNISTAFSGCKGISVTIPPEVFNAQPSNELPLILKSIAKELQARLHLKTLDVSVYDRRRLWRLLNSRHNKTGLYKIPLTLTELENLSIEQIKTLAAKPREPFIQPQTQPIPEAERLYLEHKEKTEIWLSTRKTKFEPKPQTDDPPCIKKLIEIGASKGNRNISTFQLAVYYAGKNLDQLQIEHLCTEFAAKSDQPLTPQEISTIVDSALKGYTTGRYSVGCSTFADLCDKPKCPIFTADSKPDWSKIGEPIQFDEWRQTIHNNFPDLWPYAEGCASTVASLLIKDVSPLALVLQGVPSGGKTTTLNFFKNFPLSHLTDKFSPKAFVSHVAEKTKEELGEIDLLPRLKGKVLITPDLTTTFGAREEELKETFSILTRVLDGQGLTIDSGVHGSRGYEGDYRFVWIGATTPLPHKVWDLFANLGPRFYFMKIDCASKTNDDYIADLTGANYQQKVKKCNEATLRFLKGIWLEERMEWHPENDDKSLLDKVVQVAKVLTRLRGQVNLIVKQGYMKEEINFTTPIIEEPARCIQSLYTLMRGRALLQGRTQISTEDLPIVFDVALNSAQWERLLAFSLLLANEVVKTGDVEASLKCSRNKALMAMRTLEKLGLVDLNAKQVMTEGGPQFGYTMTLKPEFKWFQTDEFRALWRQRKEQPNMPLLPEPQKPEDTLMILEDLTHEGPQETGEDKKEDTQTNNQ
jgi:predicted transcriptional regulator